MPLLLVVTLAVWITAPVNTRDTQLTAFQELCSASRPVGTLAPPVVVRPLVITRRAIVYARTLEELPVGLLYDTAPGVKVFVIAFAPRANGQVVLLTDTGGGPISQRLGAGKQAVYEVLSSEFGFMGYQNGYHGRIESLPPPYNGIGRKTPFEIHSCPKGKVAPR